MHSYDSEVIGPDFGACFCRSPADRVPVKVSYLCLSIRGSFNTLYCLDDWERWLRGEQLRYLGRPTGLARPRALLRHSVAGWPRPRDLDLVLIGLY
jgi:hypothetical protein